MRITSLETTTKPIIRSSLIKKIIKLLLLITNLLYHQSKALRQLEFQVFKETKAEAIFIKWPNSSNYQPNQMFPWLQILTTVKHLSEVIHFHKREKLLEAEDLIT